MDADVMNSCARSQDFCITIQVFFPALWTGFVYYNSRRRCTAGEERGVISKFPSIKHTTWYEQLPTLIWLLWKSSFLSAQAAPRSPRQLVEVGKRVPQCSGCNQVFTFCCKACGNLSENSLVAVWNCKGITVDEVNFSLCVRRLAKYQSAQCLQRNEERMNHQRLSSSFLVVHA